MPFVIFLNFMFILSYTVVSAQIKPIYIIILIFVFLKCLFNKFFSADGVYLVERKLILFFRQAIFNLFFVPVLNYWLHKYLFVAVCFFNNVTRLLPIVLLWKPLFRRTSYFGYFVSKNSIQKPKKFK